MDAKTFNFAPKSSQMGFSAPNFVFLYKNFRTIRYSDSQKFTLGNCPLPPCHNDSED